MTYDTAIERVEAQIGETDQQIRDVERDIAKCQKALYNCDNTNYFTAYLPYLMHRTPADRAVALEKEKEQLRKETEQLRKETEQLRKEKEQLREEKMQTKVSQAVCCCSNGKDCFVTYNLPRSSG